MNNQKLFYLSTAKNWNEALPLGNGRIGAMVFGKTDCDLISLNEDTLWSGKPINYSEESLSEHYKKACELTLEGKLMKAQEYIEENLTAEYTNAYMPLGDLKINFNHSEVSNYRRELDLKTAACTVEYTFNGINYKRTYFVSHPKQLMFVHITSDKAGAVSFELEMESQLKNSVYIRQECLLMYGECPSQCDPLYHKSEEPIIYSENELEKGIRFCGAVKIFNHGGDVLCENNSLKVIGADSVLIAFSTRTSFKKFDIAPIDENKNTVKQALADLNGVKIEDYDALLCEHIKDHSHYYERVKFNINQGNFTDIPTDERLERYKLDRSDISLPVLLFNFGRYLLISSSRAGSTATNLQGIWNNQIFPAWSSNYTININTQMNYWPVFAANLHELSEPLVRLISELSVTGENVARKWYDAKGACAHHNTSIWMPANPVGDKVKGSARYAFWNMSYAWFCRSLYEYYAYTLDIDFLKNTAYSLIKKAVEFIIDIAVKNKNGHYTFPASTSPENAFVFEGKPCVISANATMSSAIAMDISDIFTKCSEILGIDDDFTLTVRNFRKLIIPFSTDEYGALSEWVENLTESEPLHRHISHLYAFHPANLINPDKDTELTEAVKTSLERRGDDGPGWALGWKVNQWARLRDGNRCLKIFEAQLNLVPSEQQKYAGSGGTYPNMLGAHPPFQIDGNFGAVAATTQMLLQSHLGYIHLLPALPEKWDSGSITGLKAEGNITVDIIWENGKLCYANLSSDKKKSVKIRYRDDFITAEISEKPLSLKF